MVTRLQFC